MAVNLANPGALLWAALAIPIVIFYILKIRLRRVPVSTSMFWQQIFDEKQPRSIWQRLRHLLSLLLQLAFLSLLVAALAEPFFPWEALQARRLVLVVDNSASMRATDESPTRLAKAKEEGQRIIQGLRVLDELAIIAAGSQPKVVCGLTGHQGTLRDALESVPDSDGPTRVAEAVSLGRRLLAGHENGQIVLLTDGCFEKAAELAAAEDVEAVPVGQRTGNVGITRFQVRRSLLDPIGYEILADVVNFSDEPVELRLEIDLEDEVVDVVPLKLEPGKPWSQVFEKTSASGGRLVARLDRPDILASDNQAIALLPRRERQRVILVTEGNLFLSKVFEANPLVELTVQPKLPEKIPAGAVLAIHRSSVGKLPAGNVIVIGPTVATDQWELGPKLENPIVTKQDKDSPLMAHVRLDNVLMPDALQLKPIGNSKTLAESVTGDPLYLSFDRPEGKTVVLTVDLDQGDLPLRTAFPILMSNALAWFAGNKGDLRESLATGDVTEISLPADRIAAESTSAEAGLVLTSPEGADRPVMANAQVGALSTGPTVTVGPLEQCGIWKVERLQSGDDVDDSEQRETLSEVACNLASAAESDLRRPEALESSQAVLTAGIGGRPIWFYLLFVGLMLAAMEWFFYQRRWIS